MATEQPRRAKVPAGIRERHQRSCATRQGKSRCSCVPSFEALVALGKAGQRKRRTFATLSQAKDWRTEQLAAKTRQRLRAPASVTLRETAERYVAGMRAGTIATRSGERYKPSVVRGYEQALASHVLPDLGGRRLGDVTSGDLQRLVERLRGAGLSASTIANAINPVQAIYRRAIVLGEVPYNPTRDVVLPVIRGRRAHGGDAGDALQLLAAVPERDRCAWALAFFAGLRLGELRALRWEDVDSAGSIIRVRRSWDDREGEITTKSAAGERNVPILAALRPMLDAQRARCPWAPRGLVLGKTAEAPFHYNGLYRRSSKAWAAAGLPRITPHQARHSFASLLIASGANVKVVTEILGHSSVRQSFDRYGHLFADAHATTAARLDALIASADTAAPRKDTNPYHPLKPGLQWVRGGTTEVGSRVVPHEIITTMTDVMRMIDGVPTIAMLDESTDSGEVSQESIDYLALDKDGNVWILGGYTEDYEGGQYTNTDSAFLGAGGGAEVGVLAPARVDASTPRWFIGAAPDEKASVGTPVKVGVRECVSFGCYDNVRVVQEGNVGAPDNENKYYAPGVGVINNIPLDASLHQDTFDLRNFVELSPKGLAEASQTVLDLETHARKTSPEVFGSAPQGKRAT